MLGGLDVEEVDDPADEAVDVLEVAAVIGVGEQPELGVGEVQVEEVRVAGGYHDVVVSVDHQRGPIDPAEVVEAACGGRAPVTGGGAVGGDGHVRYRNVSVIGAGGDALDEGPPGGPAFLGGGEHDRQPHVVAELVSLGEQRGDVGR